jgi:hypothetical protein
MGKNSSLRQNNDALPVFRSLNFLPNNDSACLKCINEDVDDDDDDDDNDDDDNHEVRDKLNSIYSLSHMFPE